MNQLFIKEIQIEEVRHLHDITIPTPNNDATFRHIIFTGKNGSGKTSLLDAIAGYLDSVSKGDTPSKFEKLIDLGRRNLSHATDQGDSQAIYDTEKRIERHTSRLTEVKCGLNLTFNIDENRIRKKYEKGECVFAYFKAQRVFNAEEPTSIEKVTFKDCYGINESPRELFIKYMLDLKMTQALASSNGKQQKADDIQQWFDQICGILRDIYDDPSLTIEFDEDTYRFTIHEQGRDSFDFNSASDGFSAVLDIVVGLMLRMKDDSSRLFNLDIPGIVLIDEIENHLHLSLQRRIVPFLSELFPNIQFIVTTHSPFVLTSTENAVVFDLENHTLVKDGLSDNTYESIVKGYFNVDSLSNELRNKYDRYKVLANKESLNEDDLIEISELEVYLDEIPDYLALDIATEYKKIRLQMRSKDLS